MSLFPANARTGQTHKKFGRKYVYSETTETWQPVVPLASKAEIKRAAATATGATTFYATANELPLSNNTTGAMAFVQETNRLYIWSGTGWYNIATIQSAGASISGANASYALAKNGTPTVVTLTQSGLTSPTWSYEVTSGSLGRTATVTQSDNVFTITPSTTEDFAGSFSITFTATDGSNTLVATSQLTLEFIPDWANATLLNSIQNPNPYGTSASDRFGGSVDIDGNYAIISAMYEDESTVNVQSGKAYIYNVTTGSLIKTLNNPNAYGTSASDFFGRAVGISGNYAIVSAHLEDDAGGISSGKAYIYHTSLGDWSDATLAYTLDDPNAYGTSANDSFGYALAIDGNYAIVSAPGEQDAGSGGNSSGKAYIFNVTTGSLVHTLDNPTVYGTSANDSFGASVAIGGNYAIVGASDEDANGINSGTVYIFNVTTGSLVHTLNDPSAYDIGTYDNFGTSVAIGGNYAIVGTYNEDDASGNSSGKAYIYNVTTGSLLHTLDNPNPVGTSTSDYFSWSLAIDGNYAVASAIYEKNASGTQVGKAYIFDVTTGSLVKTLDDPDPVGTGADEFGRSLAISGSHIIVGAWNEDDASGTNSGRVYIYKAG